jgi:hypothetical protein
VRGSDGDGEKPKRKAPAREGREPAKAK